MRMGFNSPSKYLCLVLKFDVLNLYASMLLSIFFCHPNDSTSFFSNGAKFCTFFLDATCAYLKNCQGQQKDLPLKKVNSHHGPKVESTND
jgi:hypothetical protein